MAKFIGVDGVEKEVWPKKGKEFSLLELQNFCEPAGGGSKTITIIDLPSGKRMVANDEGKLLGLEKNEKATAIWIKEFPIDEYPLNNSQLIVGNVLIATPEEVGEEEDCAHEYEMGRCVACGDVYEENDFSGATPGDR